MKISENTAISMPMKNLISIVVVVAVGVWSYFGVTEQLNNHSTKILKLQDDVEKLKDKQRNFKSND